VLAPSPFLLLDRQGHEEAGAQAAGVALGTDPPDRPPHPFRIGHVRGALAASLTLARHSSPIVQPSQQLFQNKSRYEFSIYYEMEAKNVFCFSVHQQSLSV